MWNVNANMQGPEAHLGAKRRVVLHVGCGEGAPQKLHRAFRKPGWREIRLDIDPRVKPDIVALIADLSMIETTSCDGIWGSHVLEHLYSHEVMRALSEFHRVLKPGGLLLLRLPDLQTVAELVAADKLSEPVYKSKSGVIRPLDMLFGFSRAIAKGNLGMAHHTGFTRGSLRGALRRAGFSGVRVRRDRYDLWARAIKMDPRQQMGKIRLVCFAGAANSAFDARMRSAQAELAATARDYGFDEVISWDRQRLHATEFYASNRDILDRDRGGGYWLWKPFIILEALRSAADDDVIVYWDVGRGVGNKITRPIAPLVQWCLKHDGMLPGVLIHPHGPYTKRDCFHYMGCDSPKYWNARQVQATFSIWSGKRAIEFVSEWLHWCCDRRCLTDDPNECGLPNLPGFVDHRHDQSILTNLCTKHNVAALDPLPIAPGRWTKNMNACAEALERPQAVMQALAPDARAVEELRGRIALQKAGRFKQLNQAVRVDVSPESFGSAPQHHPIRCRRTA